MTGRFLLPKTSFDKTGTESQMFFFLGGPPCQQKLSTTSCEARLHQRVLRPMHSLPVGAFSQQTAARLRLQSGTPHSGGEGTCRDRRAAAPPQDSPARQRKEIGLYLRPADPCRSRPGGPTAAAKEEDHTMKTGRPGIEPPALVKRRRPTNILMKESTSEQEGLQKKSLKIKTLKRR